MPPAKYSWYFLVPTCKYLNSRLYSGVVTVYHQQSTLGTLWYLSAYILAAIYILVWSQYATSKVLSGALSPSLSSLLSTYTSKEDGACIFNVITPQILPFCPWHVNVHTTDVISSLIKFASAKRTYQFPKSHQNMVCILMIHDNRTYTPFQHWQVFLEGIGRVVYCGAL